MKYEVNDSKIYCDITDGIAVIIEVDTGTYYGLNPLTTNIFENLINGVDANELISKLTLIKGFNEEVKNKFDNFVKELIDKDFLVESKKEAAKPNINIEEFINDQDDFLLAEFKDAAELLLADPIHQVKEEEGWSPNKDSLK